MKKERKQTRKTVSKLQSLQKKIRKQEFIEVKVNGTLKRCIKLQNYMIQLILKI